MSKNIIPAIRTENITYAVRDIIVLANEVAKSGKEMLYLNIGGIRTFMILNLPNILLKQRTKQCLKTKTVMHLLRE